MTIRTVTRYCIRKYQYDGAGNSKQMSPKLKTRTAALRLIARLERMGHKDVFADPLIINEKVPAK